MTANKTPRRIIKQEKIKPIKPNLRLEESLQKEITKYLFDLLYKNIFLELKIKKNQVIENKRVDNSASGIDLITAIKSGRIIYKDNIFSGKFSAKISKQIRDLGGKRISSGWQINQLLLPQNILQEIYNYNLGFEAAKSNIVSSLSSQRFTSNPVFVDKILKKYIYNLKLTDRLFLRNTASLSEKAQSILVNYQINDKIKVEMARLYSLNLEKYIVSFANEEVLKIRNIVEKEIFKNSTRKQLIDKITNRFGVSERKAKFLADQETKLFNSAYTYSRYTTSGVNKYIWSTSGDNRVREDHKLLDGKVFDFNDPPVVDLETGRRANPSEDFNCRCVAIPIVEY